VLAQNGGMFLRCHVSTVLVRTPLAVLMSAFACLTHSSSLLALPDQEQAIFERCASEVRVNCVVDGDTLWYRGIKIRIADINAPEVSRPRCVGEARLGAQATRKVAEWLNTGPFALRPVERQIDAYGRHLFIITRDGTSLGEHLVDEGLAKRWRGVRSDWCRSLSLPAELRHSRLQAAERKKS
jgi:micrococcal nuclease